MFDSLFCGNCARIFKLCTIDQFIQHKVAGCSKSAFGNQFLMECFHCDECYFSPLDLILHVQLAHGICILKHIPVSTFNNNYSTNSLTSNSLCAFDDKNNKNIQLDSCSTNSTSIISHSVAQFSDDTNDSSLLPVFSENDHSSKPSQIRKTCCLVDGTSPCNQMSTCPILFSAENNGDIRSNLETSSTKYGTNLPLFYSDAISASKETTISVTKKLSNFLCEYCDKKFSQKIHLQKHIMSTHTKIKPFKCNLCSYETVEKSHLKIHFRKHTGEKPFSCLLCNYKATQHSTLKQHCIKKHQNMLFDCKICNFGSITSTELENHEKTCVV